MPALKEKKRFLAIEVITQQSIDFIELEANIQEAFRELAGTIAAGNAGVVMIHNKVNKKNNRALMRVHKDYLNLLRASLMFVQYVVDEEAVVHSIGASGMLTKAYDKYIAI